MPRKPKSDDEPAPQSPIKKSSAAADGRRTSAEAQRKARVAAALAQYECGPVRFSGDENASYERHLVFDYVVTPEEANPRQRFEAVARSLRDLLS